MSIDDNCEHEKPLKQTERLKKCECKTECQYRIEVFGENYCKKNYGDPKDEKTIPSES